MRGNLNHDQDIFRCLEEAEFLYQPPENLVEDVTPWRNMMKWTLMGIVLYTLATGIVALDLPLIAAGAVLMYLGLRPVRKESKWLAAAYGLTLCLAVLGLFRVAVGCTIWHTAVWVSAPGKVVSWLQHGLVLGLLLCIHQGIRDIQRRNDAYEDARYVLLAMGLYVVKAILPLLPFSDLREVAGLLVVAVFAWSLYKAYRNMGEAGYGIHPLPIKLRAWVLWLITAVVVLVCVVAGVVFFQQYPMQWQQQKPVAVETESIRQDLMGLGMPQKVAQDLSEADIQLLQGAMAIETFTSQNKEQTVTTTTVAVALPEGVKLIHHFRWNTAPSFRGTEMLYIRCNSDTSQETFAQSTGSVLYDRDGQTMESEFYYMGMQSYYNAVIYYKDVNYEQRQGFVASFSFPHESENCRGYIIYDIDAMPEQLNGVRYTSYYAQYEPMFLTHCTGVMEYITQGVGIQGGDPYFKIN